MGDFIIDTFKGAPGALLDSRAGEVGATWLLNPNFADPTSSVVLSPTQTIYQQTVNQGSAYDASGLAPTLDYTIQVGIDVKSILSVFALELYGRAGITGNYDRLSSFLSYNAGIWTVPMYKIEGFVYTLLGTAIIPTVPIGSHVLQWEMIGSNLRILWDYVCILIVNSNYGPSSTSGLRIGGGTTPAETATTGVHLSSFRAYTGPAQTGGDQVALRMGTLGTGRV